MKRVESGQHCIIHGSSRVACEIPEPTLWARYIAGGQSMNVLARISNGPAQPTDAPAPNTTPQRSHTLGSPRAYSGPSIISGTLNIIGRLEGSGDIQIDGKIEGDIRGQNI